MYTRSGVLANRIDLATAIIENINCDGRTEEIFVETGSVSSDVILDKSEIEIVEITKNETTTRCCDSNSAMYVCIKLQNTGKTIPEQIPVVVEIFCDMNENGNQILLPVLRSFS